ncbi:ribonuclease H-like domain-containing protein [Armillaria borealis]|uniref:Ribonuclease H-like domain-containing protein n=1 Tax=Armillaria borealis TaxID=47425 RepID=A0AA39J2Y1_9AGAR|nr:ribonuclease H-like domain-containing protein [Armillaria borealis]
MLSSRCFAHIVNLAAKAVISAVTALNAVLLGETLDITRDPIAAVQALVRAIRGSSLRRHGFASVLKMLDKKVLQLVLDVDIRWSSTDIMIEWAIELREGIELFLDKRDFTDLRKHKLSKDEWKALEIIHQILAVPHAFQQKLSADKTPTLSLAIPSFRRMIQLWQGLKITFPDAAPALDEGLEKLATYRERLDIVPAYTLATSEQI